MKSLRAAVAALLLIQIVGCGAMQRPMWNKPWTYRSGVASAVCGAIGAGAGVGIQQARTSCATVNNMGASSQNCSSIGNSNDNTFWLWGALIGAASGAILCGILGHLFLDPSPELAMEMPPPPLEPEAAPVPPPTQKRIVLRGVQFGFDSSTISPEAAPVLDQAATLLKENPDVLVVIEGHTDSIGSDEYNMALSIRRAEAVYRYLVNRGVDPERLRVESYGKTRPVADNDSEAARAQNRRVELHPKQ